MNWKLVVLGGLAWYLATFAIGLATVPIIHEGIQRDTYHSIPEFFRPELMAEPPEVGALMPYWVVTGLISSFLFAALYGWFRPALRGPGWKRGLLFGLGMGVTGAAIFVVYSGILDLPPRVWVGWIVDDLILRAGGGAALGWAAAKVAPHQD